MTTENELCTFIASIRVDLRMIASIAKFMQSKGVFAGSTGRIASEAVKILANTTQRKFPVRSHSEAVIELRKMGYGDCFMKGTRHYNALYGQVELEQQSAGSQADIDSITDDLVKRAKESQSYAAPVNTAGMESVIAPAEPEPEAETPQLKVRTPKNEKADISRLRKGLMEGAPAEVLEENKTS